MSIPILWKVFHPLKGESTLQFLAIATSDADNLQFEKKLTFQTPYAIFWTDKIHLIIVLSP